MIELTGMEARQVEDSARKLRKHGFLERTETGCHRLTTTGRAAYEKGICLTSGPKGRQATGQRPRDAGLRQRIWNVLRMHRKYSQEDIMLLVLEGDELNPANNVGKYLRALAKAGYLIRMPVREKPASRTSNGTIRWLLLKDTGPFAPVWRQSRATLYDPNLEQEITCTLELSKVSARKATTE